MKPKPSFSDDGVDVINDNILEFDITILEVECAKQAKLFFKWAEIADKVDKRLDDAERELKVIDAKLDDRFRTAKGGDKPTETAIKNKIVLDPRHIAQEEIISKRRYKLKLLNHFVASLDQRKRMLEKAVDLHGQKYFATPMPNERNREHLAELERQTVRRKGR